MIASLALSSSFHGVADHRLAPFFTAARREKSEKGVPEGEGVVDFAAKEASGGYLRRNRESLCHHP